jgi:dolichol-phosphate mannosyltransferase
MRFPHAAAAIESAGMEDAQGKPITFSFVVPVCNEQEGLPQFHGRLKAVAEQLGERYEVVFVNDGSTDDSARVLRTLAAEDTHVKVVDLSRNFGHQIAVTAGYDYAAGQAVISLDADCQHPPEVIPNLVARWREGFEVVHSVRRGREGIPRVRGALGRLVCRVIRLAAGAELTDQADFRLMDRKAVDALRAHREHARFVRGLVRWIGFRQVGVPYTPQARAAGKSSYLLRQLAAMAGAGVFNFSRRPLRLIPALGGILVGAAVVYAVVALLAWALAAAPSAWVSLAMAVVGLFGLQFVLLGILGEYVGRVFDEAKARPLYVVRQTLGFRGEAEPAGPAERPPAPRRRPDDINIYT